MTTIAYRDGILAADSLAVSDGIPCRCTKIFRLSDGAIVGFSGKVDLCMRFLAGLRGGEKSGFTEAENKDFHALIVRRDGSVEEWETDRAFSLVEDAFYAIGSGRQAAMAAMHMGAGAVQAVNVAILCDVSSGGPVVAQHIAGGA